MADETLTGTLQHPTILMRSEMTVFKVRPFDLGSLSRWSYRFQAIDQEAVSSAPGTVAGDQTTRRHFGNFSSQQLMRAEIR
jgi:hypothetical protein